MRNIIQISNEWYSRRGFSIVMAAGILIGLICPRQLFPETHKARLIPEKFPDSFPLVEGMVWHYSSNLGEATSTVSRVEDGYALRSEAPHLVIEQILTTDDWGVTLIRGSSRVYFIETTRVYQPWMPRFPFLPRIGQEWDWEGDEVVDGDEVIKSQIKGKIEAREKITVPAGTFDCLKVVVTTISSDGTKSSSIQWVTEGIGPVKARIEIDAGGLTGAMIWLLGFDVLEFDLVSVERPEADGPSPSASPLPSLPPPNPLSTSGRRSLPRGISH